MDKSVLRELGLTNNEIEVYLTLLRKSSISANEIAEKAGLHRQAVYDALDRLLEKGFASYVIEKNKKFFQGVHPEKIIDFIKEKESDFRSILPQLVKITKSSQDDTFVEVFRGRKIVRAVYRDIMKELEKKPGDVLISGVDETKFLDEDVIALEQHLKRLKKLKCMEKVLIREGDTHLVKGSQTKYKWVPEESFNSTPMYVYGDKLTIIIWGEPDYAIIIKNKGLADSYRKQFNLLWKISEEID